MPRSTRSLPRPSLFVVGIVAAIGIVAAFVARSQTFDRAVPTTAPGGPDGPAVVGLLDGVRRIGAGVEVTGWASDAGGTPLQIRLLVDGARVATVMTGEERLDVNVALGRSGAASGFHTVISVPRAAAAVCADAVAGGGGVTRLGCLPLDATPARADTRAIEELADQLVAEAEAALGFEIAIAVVPLDTDALAGHDIRRPFISASSAKAWWTAAALRAGAVENAQIYAAPVFEESSDSAAGTMIDLAGGIDAVNGFTLSLGMEATGALKWNVGAPRVASRPDGPLGKSNFTTAADAAGFGALLATGRVLNPASTELLLGWMRTTPRIHTDTSEVYPGVGSMIPQGLPRSQRGTVAHKAGWLLPGEFPAVPTHLLDVGIVFPATGRSYAIALMAAGAHDDTRYGRLVQFFEHVSCRVYLLMSDDQRWTCEPW